eukprot:sb/3472300/
MTQRVSFFNSRTPTRTIDPQTMLPRDITLKGSSVPGAGMGVWALLHIPRRTRFGPFCGMPSPTPRPTAASHPSACWPIFENKGSVVHYLLAPESEEPTDTDDRPPDDATSGYHPEGIQCSRSGNGRLGSPSYSEENTIWTILWDALTNSPTHRCQSSICLLAGMLFTI